MKKLLLLLTLISRFAFGQGSISTEYNSTTKKSYLKTGVFPKANVITYTDTSVNKSPVWWFNTGRIKFKNSIVAIDTADFDGILVSKGDSLLLADKNLMVIGVTNGLTLSSGFAKIGGTLTDSTVIDMNNRSLVFKTNSADVNKEVIKITDESDNIALIVNQSGKNVIALGKNAGSGTISAEDCNFLGENAGSGATNALFSNFMGKNAGLNSTTATHSNFFGQGAGSSAPLAGGSNFLGANAGAGATNAGNSNFLGQSAGNNAVNANGSNFLGYESGNGASNANGSNFLGNFSGSNSTNANNSNFFGFVSGRNATNAYFSNFIGPGSGDAAINANNSNFFGAYTGLNSTNASNSNFFGKYAGRNAINAANSIFIGTETGDSSVNLANSIVIGKYSGRKETLNTTTGGTSIQIGNYTHTGGFNNTIAIGDSATNTKTNQVVFAPKYRHLRLRGVDYELPASQGATDTYLKNDGSGVLSWATASGGSGTVTSVTSANTDISVANTTTTPVLTLNSGSGANQIVKRDGSGNIAGYTPTTLPSGQINIGDGTNTAFPRTLSGDVTVSNLGVTSYNGIVPVNKGGTGLGEMAQWDFSDGTKKLKGLNVTMQYYSENAYWGNFYIDWSSDSAFFNKYVAPQIDWAKTNGCNSIRMIGFVTGVVNGWYTIAQYNAMQTQIIRYLASKNMYYYPCLGSLSDGLTYSQFVDTTSTGYITRCVEVCENFANYTNVIGVDMSNEIFYFTGGISTANQITFIATLKTALTAAGITLPCTASMTGGVEGIVSPFDKGNSNITNMAAYFDFIDRHIYTANTYEAPDNLTFFAKPIIYGEYGAVTSLAARMLSMPPLLAANGVIGGFMFCQNSYDNLAANQYALYDPNYIPLDPLASLYFATLIPNQGYQKKLTKVFLASFYGANTTALSSYTPDLNTPVSLGSVGGSPTLNASNQLSMPLSSTFRLNGMANGDMVRSQIISFIAFSEFRYLFYNAANTIQYTCRLVTGASSTTLTMDIRDAGGTTIATSGALTITYPCNFEMWYDGTTIRMRNGQTNVGIAVAAAGLSCDHMFLLNQAGGTAVIKQLAVFRP